MACAGFEDTELGVLWDRGESETKVYSEFKLEAVRLIRKFQRRNTVGRWFVGFRLNGGVGCGLCL